MPDANKENTLNQLVGAAFGAAGQRCMALSTAILVGEARDWLPELVERSKALRVNAGSSDRVTDTPTDASCFFELGRSLLFSVDPFPGFSFLIVFYCYEILTSVLLRDFNAILFDSVSQNNVIISFMMKMDGLNVSRGSLCNSSTEKTPKRVRLAPRFRPAGDQPGADVGPLISPEAKVRVNSLIQSGVDEGATLLLDGRAVNVKGYENGNFVGPTIISNVKVGRISSPAFNDLDF